MVHHSNFDYVYPILGIIVGIVIAVSPSTFMKAAKYNEDDLKSEKFIKKIGIALIIISIIYAIYLILFK